MNTGVSVGQQAFATAKAFRELYDYDEDEDDEELAALSETEKSDRER